MKKTFIDLQLLFLDTIAILLSVFELTFVIVFVFGVLDDSFAIKQSFYKMTVKCKIVIVVPLEFTFSLLISQMVLPYVCSFVILLFPKSLWLLVQPPATIAEPSHFIYVVSFLYPCPYEITCIGKDKNGLLVKDRLVTLIEIAFKVSLEVTILFELIQLDVSFGQ